MLCFDSFYQENISWKVGLFIQETYTKAYKTECVCTKDFTLGDINLIFILNQFVFDTLVGLISFCWKNIDFFSIDYLN